MADALALLWTPLLVAACLVAIHTFFGIQVLKRNIVFVDLALAQIAALGATVAFMLGHTVQGGASYAYSFGFTLAAALLLAFTRQWAGRIPQEALIGVIYVVAAAMAFLLVDKAPQGTEHIKQILTGNILTVGLGDLAFIAPLPRPAARCGPARTPGLRPRGRRRAPRRPARSRRAPARWRRCRCSSCARP